MIAPRRYDYDEIAERITTDELAAFLGAEKTSNGYRCPFPDRHEHGDRNPSLSIYRKGGRTVVSCMGGDCGFGGTPVQAYAERFGCSEQDAGTALGDHLRLEPSFSNGAPPQRRQHGEGLTLEQYAADKKLPIDFLRDLGLRDGDYYGTPCVEMPYRDADGEEIKTRIRTARKAKEGSKWKQTGAVPVPYGVDRLSTKKDGVLIVEGESDAQTAWLYGKTAIGIPGAGNWKREWAARLNGRQVYVWQEPDGGGRKLVRAMAADIADLLVISASDPDDAGDLNALHKACGDRTEFLARLRELVKAAKPAPEALTEGEDEWTKPRSLVVVAPEPLPIEKLPPSLRGAIEAAAEHTQAPRDLCTITALGVSCAAIMPKAKVKVRGGFETYVNILTAGQGDSGIGKSPALATLVAPLRQWEKDRRESQQADAGIQTKRRGAAAAARALRLAQEDLAKLKAGQPVKKSTIGKGADAVTEAELLNKIEELEAEAEYAPPSWRVSVDNTTEEALVRFMVRNDEYAVIIVPESGLFRILADNTYSASVSLDLLKRAWDGERYIQDRKGEENPAILERPLLTFVTMFQTDYFKDFRNVSTLRREGVFARFIYVCPRGSRRRPDPPALDRARMRAYEQTIRRLFDRAPQEAHVLTLSDGARGCYYALFRTLEDLRLSDDYGRIGDWLAKAPTNALKLAGALQLYADAEARRDWSTEVGPDAMLAAAQVVVASVPHAVAFFDGTAGSYLQLAQYVLGKLKRWHLEHHGRVPTMSDLTRMCQGKRGADKAELLRSLIQTLEEYGWARLVPLETGQPGRPPEEIHLNPEALRGEELPDDDEEIEKNPSLALSRRINSIFSSYLGGSGRENGHPEPDEANSIEDPGTENLDIPKEEQYRLWDLAKAANAAGHEDLMAAWVEAVRREEVTLASAPIWADRFQEAIGEAGMLA